MAWMQVSIDDVSVANEMSTDEEFAIGVLIELFCQKSYPELERMMDKWAKEYAEVCGTESVPNALRLLADKIEATEKK